MSKTTLKKFIKDFDAPQLQSMLLELYSRSKDAKEYLDFMAEPDVEKKTDDYKAIICKEATRYTKHAFRPRMSRLRSIIKRFRSFEPGDEAVAELMVYTLLLLIGNGVQTWLPDTLYDNISKFMNETLAYAKERNVLDEFVPRIVKMRGYICDFKGYKNPLRRIVDCGLSEAGVDLSPYGL